MNVRFRAAAQLATASGMGAFRKHERPAVGLGLAPGADIDQLPASRRSSCKAGLTGTDQFSAHHHDSDKRFDH